MRKRRLLIKLIIGTFYCFITLIACLGVSTKQFQDGDVVCFLGDSITHGGRYPFYILEYYATRYPNRKLLFHNCGISGDSAIGALRRLDWDLLNRKPNKTTIMLGMNDVNRGLYGKKNPDKKNLFMRTKAIRLHKKNMVKITDELKKKNIEIIYITPSPYDQTSAIKRENLYGVNEALLECTKFCRDLAVKNNAGLVDFHTAMTELNLVHQKTNPNFTLIGRDRVHPGKTGHFVMAYLFLKAQSVSSVVSSLKLDYKDGKLLSEKNCKVTNIRKEKKSITFDSLENSLPMSISVGYQGADKLVPVTKDLNNEIIAVVGLSDGNYELLIGGKTVIKANAKTWGRGVNIAPLPTPMHKQATAVHKLVMQKYYSEVILRGLKKIEVNMKRKKINIDSPKARAKYLAELQEKLKGSKYYIYYNRLIKSYKKNKPKENELLEKIEKINKEIYQRAKPRRHHYEIKAL